MHDARTSRLRGKTFPHRPDFVPVPCVARTVTAEEFGDGRQRQFTIRLASVVAAGLIDKPAVPNLRRAMGRDLEQQRHADAMLADAMWLARRLPPALPPQAWVVRAERIEGAGQ